MGNSTYQAWNHFIPRVYLKRFSSSPGRIWRYRCLVSHQNVREWEEVAIDAIAAQNYLYSVADDHGESDRMEQWLNQEFESPADEAIEKAIEGRQMRQSDWKRLARFFAAQYVRTPAYYVKRRQAWERNLPEMFKAEIEELKRKLPHAKDSFGVFKIGGEHELFPLRYVIERGNLPNQRQIKLEISAGRKMWIWEINQLLTKSRTLEALESHRWTLLRAPEGEEWCSSDDPAMCLGLMDNKQRSFGGGLGAKSSVLMMPLSPTLLLYTEVGEKAPPKYTELRQAKAREIGQTIINHGFRNYYANRSRTDLSALRPRKVDPEQFKKEQAEWREWHADHSAAERFVSEDR